MRSRKLNRDRAGGWARFCGWGLAGFLLASLVSQAVIFLFPLGVLVVWVMVRRTREPRELLGSLAGLGCAAGLIGVLHLHDGGCSVHGETRTLTTTTISCGGFDGKPWLTVGVLMVAVAALTYRYVGRKSGI
jgi:hypothetical protein